MSAKNFQISGKKFELLKDALKASGCSGFQKRPGGWWIAENSGRQYRFRVSQYKDKFGIHLSGQNYFGALIEAALAAVDQKEAAGDLTAQFPGKVRKILVKAGAVVKEGDKLVLVEAMKMEFAIKAPFDGRVTKVLIEEGQQISPGDRFVDLEAKNG